MEIKTPVVDIKGYNTLAGTQADRPVKDTKGDATQVETEMNMPTQDNAMPTHAMLQDMFSKFQVSVLATNSELLQRRGPTEQKKHVVYIHMHASLF